MREVLADGSIVKLLANVRRGAEAAYEAVASLEVDELVKELGAGKSPRRRRIHELVEIQERLAGVIRELQLLEAGEPEDCTGRWRYRGHRNDHDE